MTTTDAHANYRLTNVKEMDGNEGVAFSGTLTHKGKKIADVIQDGNGGQTLIHFYDGYTSKTAEDFYAAAKRIIQVDIEPEEEFLDNLRMAAYLNRKRGVLFLLDDEDFYETGACRQVNAPRDQGIAFVQKKYASRNPRIWDKKRAEFVPANEAS